MQETAKINKPYDYSGNSFIKNYLYLLVVTAVLFTLYYQRVYTNVCNKPPITSIFYQPLLKDKMNWDSNFKKLQQVHIETIILQWSKFGVVDFLKDDIWLNTILSSAQKHNIKVIVGLYGDDNYFKTLENRDTDIEEYLNNLLIQNMLQAEKVYTIAKDYNSFNGYYIYDEIDDTNFIEKKRQEYLKNYLQTMADSIKVLSKHQLYISGYFSKHMSPNNYASMFSKVTQQKYTVLLQSGIGAGLVNSNSSNLYIKKFAKEFKGKFIPIAEGFTVKDSKIQAIDFLSLQKQIKLLTKSAHTSKVSLFSLRYFLDEVLFSAYVTEYRLTELKLLIFAKHFIN